MRKRIIQAETGASPVDNEHWLDLENLVQVELTSEDEAYPIESAMKVDGGSGWRARNAGKQVIRLLFDTPLRISRIRLVFQEEAQARTQEFVLRRSPDGGASWREIVRQQYNFSPPGMTREREDYTVDLDAVTLLELCIIPDISGGDARASLAELRLA